MQGQAKRPGETDILRIIARSACEVVPELQEHEFKPADSLRELGANSTDRAEILMLTLEALDLRIPLRETFGPNNIGELARLLHERLQKS